MMKKSLFSLEVIADSLFVCDDIKCRFPVLSFRFINFPQIVIEHVEENIAHNLREQLNKVPAKVFRYHY